MASIPPETAAEIQKLEQLHGQHPESRQYFVPLADRYRRLGMVEQAESLLRDGLKRHPDYLSAHIVLGSCLADRSATEEAAEEFRYVLSVDPQNLIALRTLGELAAARGRNDEAERWYRELLAVDPMNKEARQALDSLVADRAPSREEPLAETGSAEAAETETLGWGDLVLDTAHGATTEAGDGGEEADTFAYGDIRLGTDGGAADLEWEAAEPGAGETEEHADPERDAAGLPEFLLLDETAEGEADDEEVVTETIAELYTRQGFHDRAADVYRELIRRRGEDPSLQARLAGAERAAGGEPEDEGEAPELLDSSLAFAPSINGAGEDRASDVDGAFAASFAGGFPERPEVADVEDPSPDARRTDWTPVPGFGPTEEAGEAAAVPLSEGGRSIREALGAVLGWTPASEPDELPPPAPEPPIEAAPPPAAAESSVPQVEEEADLSWLSEILDGPAAEPGSGDVHAAREATPPWEDAPAHSEEPPAPPAAGAEGDDEDLESFQAWLQSLKR